MPKQYDLKTKRLGLRLLDENEIKHVEKLSAEQADEQFKARVAKFVDQFRKKGMPSFAIYELTTNQFTGGAGFSEIEGGEIEIAYVFDKKYWGNGYATEALDALLKWARKHVKAEYIIAYTVSEHFAAQRVLDKCGMVHYKTDAVEGIECRFYRSKNK